MISLAALIAAQNKLSPNNLLSDFLQVMQNYAELQRLLQIAVWLIDSRSIFTCAIVKF